MMVDTTRPESWFNQVCKALGLFDGARPVSPQRVLWDEVLPTIAALKANNPESGVLVEENQRVQMLWRDALSRMADANRRAGGFLRRAEKAEAELLELRKAANAGATLSDQGATESAQSISGSGAGIAPVREALDDFFDAILSHRGANDHAWLVRHAVEFKRELEGAGIAPVPLGAVKAETHTFAVRKAEEYLRRAEAAETKLEAGIAPVIAKLDEAIRDEGNTYILDRCAHYDLLVEAREALLPSVVARQQEEKNDDE